MHERCDSHVTPCEYLSSNKHRRSHRPVTRLYDAAA